MARTKDSIINAGIAGIPVHHSDIATVARSHRSLKYRHVWPTDTDGRVWDTMKRSVTRYAQQLANDEHHSVAILSKEGWMIDVIEPA